MSRVSVELIPRNSQGLLEDLAVTRSTLPAVQTINIPDLLRFDLRSHDAACLLIRQAPMEVIPHVRAIDIAPDAPLPGADRPELTSVLVIAGDPPPDADRPVWPNTSEEIITRYRREAPHLKVYAAFDPYRLAPWHELDIVRRKRDAGACGFFTQPLFDCAMLEMCMEWLRDDSVFWGISPVVGERSRRYWERVNHVVFPHDFPADLEGNIAAGRKMLSLIHAKNDDAYLMPVKVDLASYLGAFHDIITG